MTNLSRSVVQIIGGQLVGSNEAEGVNLTMNGVSPLAATFAAGSASDLIPTNLNSGTVDGSTLTFLATFCKQRKNHE